MRRGTKLLKLKGKAFKVATCEHSQCVRLLAIKLTSQRKKRMMRDAGHCKSALAMFVVLRTCARKFSNIDFFLRLLPLNVDELVMSEM